MRIAIDGSQVRIECDRQDYADVILPIFAELGSRADLRVVDDDGWMHAGGGWEAITVLADHAAVAPLLTAAAIAGGIAAGEVVKEMTKDAYKAVKAAIPKCISAATKQIPSFHRLRTTDQLVRESFLGIRIYVLPPDLSKPSDRASLDISLESSSRESIVLSDGVVEEALWLFEKRLAPLRDEASIWSRQFPIEAARIFTYEPIPHEAEHRVIKGARCPRVLHSKIKVVDQAAHGPLERNSLHDATLAREGHRPRSCA